MICPNCGTELQDGTQFCTNCGTPQMTSPVEATPIAVPPIAPTMEPVIAPAAEPVIAPMSAPVAAPTPKKKKTGVIIAIILVLVLLAAAAVGVFFWLEHEKSTAYDDAMALLEEGKIGEALDAFEDLGDYEDAPDMVDSISDYQKALKLLDEHKYDDALELFRELDDFHDSETYVDAGVEYHKACYIRDCAETGEAEGLAWTAYAQNAYDAPERMCCDLYLAAAEIFEALGDYRDSADLAGECREAADLLEIELVDGKLRADILGTWTVDITFTEEMLGVAGINLGGIPITFTFDDEGGVTLAFDDDAAKVLEEKMLDIMIDMMYEEMEAQGYSREQTDKTFESYYGMSITDYMKEYLYELDILGTLGELEETFEYAIENGKLILEDSEMDLEINGDTMTITACSDDTWGELGLELPIVMKRVD